MRRFGIGPVDNARSLVVYNFITDSWSSLGGGVGGGDSFVYALLLDSAAGRLYLGGSFDQLFNAIADTSPAFSGQNCVAAWDTTLNGGAGGGATTQPPPLGTIAFNTNVAALAMHLGALYAGGAFDHSTAVAGVKNIAVLAPGATQWAPVKAGVAGPASSVSALLSIGGRLVAAGSFSSLDGDAPGTLPYCAVWDNSSWTACGGTGMSNSVGPLLALNDTHVVVGGSFSGPYPPTNVVRLPKIALLELSPDKAAAGGALVGFNGGQLGLNFDVSSWGGMYPGEEESSFYVAGVFDSVYSAASDGQVLRYVAKFSLADVATPAATASGTPSPTATASGSATYVLTASGTVTTSGTLTSSATGTATPTPSSSVTLTQTRTSVPTASPTTTAVPVTPTPTGTANTNTIVSTTLTAAGIVAPAAAVVNAAKLGACCAARSGQSNGGLNAAVTKVTGSDGSDVAYTGVATRCTDDQCAAYGYRGRRRQLLRQPHAEGADGSSASDYSRRLDGSSGRAKFALRFTISEADGGSQEGWRVMQRLNEMKTDPSRLVDWLSLAGWYDAVYADDPAADLGALDPRIDDITYEPSALPTLSPSGTSTASGTASHTTTSTGTASETATSSGTASETPSSSSTASGTASPTATATASKTAPNSQETYSATSTATSAACPPRHRDWHAFYLESHKGSEWRQEDEDAEWCGGWRHWQEVLGQRRSSVSHTAMPTRTRTKASQRQHDNNNSGPLAPNRRTPTSTRKPGKRQQPLHGDAESKNGPWSRGSNWHGGASVMQLV